MSQLPIVCIPCNHFDMEGAPAHFVKHQYIKPLVEISKCIPLLIPAIGKDFDIKSLAGRIDGLLLTGAPSHVNPVYYGAERMFREQDLDRDRDETDLPLIRAAVEMDLPLFGICRGFQEMNVALGGTLHQHVHKLPGKLDHRANNALAVKERYEERRHKVAVQKGGLFESLNIAHAFVTNSLHQQGIDKLAHGLFVEAVAEDGLIEAASVPGKKFVLGTQWHPEGDFWLNPISVALFEEFGRAIRKK
jgi:putative glutamine amidotransferase